MVPEHSGALLLRWQKGDESAAEVLFRRYFSRLRALIQRRLSQRLTARLDAEDVVQSTFHSFFAGARAGCYAVKNNGDLWPLLAAIALNKVRQVQRQHSAAKRDFALEQLSLPARGEGSQDAAWQAHDPSPEEVATMSDEVEALLHPLHAVQRRIVELRLEGYTLDEIADEVRFSQRTVRRTMEQVKRHLQHLLDEAG